ncbi:hypothetical protein SDC9_180777 [bioreactor metagenome]|uniref:Uncharacterized protein n=1 Tax=bioreactor metagenome TaxID=1076179 RepID=A0A645H4N7_9ZZZZ
MKLHRKALFAGVIHPFTTAVVRVDKRQLPNARKAFGHHRIPVVLAGNEGARPAHLRDRLVDTAVAVLHFDRTAAHGKRKQLVPKANAK